MALRFFENAVLSEGLQMPNEAFSSLQQAAIDKDWETTTAKHTVYEQDGFGKLLFHEIEVWFDYVVGVTSTFLKNGNDYRKLIFRSIDHPCERGLYYKFEDSYWLADFTDPMITLQKFVAVRRCNNWLRMVDPENGAVTQWPCVIDYDATSPSPQVGSDIILPNNHLTVMVQGNSETSRLFKLNTRFLLGGRAFKIQAYQNALMPTDSTEQTNLLYLDLYLDELHDNDNQETQIADNGEYVYTVQIESSAPVIDLPVGKIGKLSASVLLNGREVKRNVAWQSDDVDTVEIDLGGSFVVKQESIKPVTVTAYLDGNPAAKSSIEINAVVQDNILSVVNIIPNFNKIRQYEIINFAVELKRGDEALENVESTVSLAKDELILHNQFLSIQQLEDNKYSIKALSIPNSIQPLYITAELLDKSLTASKELSIKVVSMMG